MPEKAAGIFVAAAGVMIGAISLLADVAGIGQHPSLGLLQLAGLLVGIGAVTGGVWLWLRGSSSERGLGRRFPPFL